MYRLQLRPLSAATWLRAGLVSAALYGGCSIDRKPAPPDDSSAREPIRLRDRDASTSGAASDVDAGDGSPSAGCTLSCEHQGRCAITAAGARCDCEAGWSGDRCERNLGGCSTEPCANGGQCDDSDGGIRCNCSDGWSGDTCEQRCGDGVVDPNESCDEGADNGKPGHCDAQCALPAEQLSLRQPGAGERVVNPVFFDWQLVGARAGTKYCAMLMTDRLGTPEDRIGEQAFYADTATELVLTLNSERYRGAFSFAVIVVACADASATCQSFDCIPGQQCPLPCAGRTITSETRALLGVRPQ